MVEFLMPSLGADMEDGTLIEWRKKEGDTVSRGDIIADVETQKGLIEIEIFENGIIEKILIKEGTKVPVGTPMALINLSGKTEIKKIEATSVKEAGQQPVTEKVSGEEFFITPGERKIKASPLARRMAAENSIDLSLVKGTGENETIHKVDVERAIEEQKSTLKKKEPDAERDSGKDKNITETIHLAVAAAMSRSNREIPHYYLEKKIDMARSLAWINKINLQLPVRKRLLPVAILVKAVARSLRDVPELNAVWDSGLQLKNEINIGFVVSLRNGGVIVPAIQGADLKNTSEIMESLNDIIPRARALKLKSSELSESTVTITSIGEGGADTVYGIIYPPQVAIIGLGSISEQPFAENGLLGVRPVIHVTLSGDHRATDGLTGSRFLTALNKHLQTPESL